MVLSICLSVSIECILYVVAELLVPEELLLVTNKKWHTHFR